MAMVKVLFSGLYIVVSLYLQGCATEPKADSMIVSDFPSTRKMSSQFKTNIELGTIIGGIDHFWTLDVTADAYKIALQSSLRNAKYLAESNLLPGKYILNAAFSDVVGPLMGVSFDSKMTVHYTLIERKTNRVLIDQPIYSQGKATFSDSIFGSNRARFAKERAVRNNLNQLLNLLDTYDEKDKSVLK